MQQSHKILEDRQENRTVNHTDLHVTSGTEITVNNEIADERIQRVHGRNLPASEDYFFIKGRGYFFCTREELPAEVADDQTTGYDYRPPM